MESALYGDYKLVVLYQKSHSFYSENITCTNDLRRAPECLGDKNDVMRMLKNRLTFLIFLYGYLVV